MSRSIYWFICAVAVVFGVVALFVSTRIVDGRWMSFGLGALLTVVGLCMFIRPETVVESDARIVRRNLRLFGRFQIWTRQFTLSDFVAVEVEHVRRSGGFNDPDSFFVWLQRRTGRKLLISYFEADSTRACRTAEELAHRLAADLQIKIVESTPK